MSIQLLTAMVLSTQEQDGYRHGFSSPILFLSSFLNFIFFSDPLFFPSLCQVIEGFNQISFLFWQFNDMINVPFSSEPFVAGLLALFLDFTLHQKDSQTKRDRGMHWWDRFRNFHTDTRSEEFYSLPFNLNKFFPSVWSLGHVVLKLCDQVMRYSYILLCGHHIL